MKSGKIGNIKWETGDDGSLHISGSGTVTIDTKKSAVDGMMEVEGHEQKISMCPGCQQWLTVIDGELVHNDIQTIKCVLES